jgi:uncharacterized protein
MKHLLLLLFITCAQSPTAKLTKNQILESEKDFYAKLSDAALQLTEDETEYDPTYYKIPYPNGDIPKGKGVCTDVIIRAYRKLSIDLQKEVHEDMAANFSKYPKAWGLKGTDTNIDHRRVPNLQVFFTRKGESLPVTTNASSYKVGDIVTWMLPANHPHIGVVVDKKGAGGRYKVVHNIGSGQNLDDCLFDWKITGHYRYKK